MAVAHGEDADLFRGAMAEFGWTGLAAAVELGVSADTVSAWKLGQTRVPGPVKAYIGLKRRVLALTQDKGPHP